MELLLADNGVGIEKEDLKHIFERIYKCDKGRSEKGSSSCEYVIVLCGNLTIQHIYKNCYFFMKKVVISRTWG